MKKTIFFIVALIFINGVSFAEALKAETPKAQAPGKPVLVREIVNFHMITPRIMRGAQPKDQAFKLLKSDAGVKTVVDLRGEKGQAEKEQVIVEGLGMAFVSIPMSAGRQQAPETINRVLKIMTDKSKQPVFVHCAAGKDRTGMIFAAYRIKYDHWSLEDAVKEMLAYGYDRNCCSAMEKSLIEWKGRR